MRFCANVSILFRDAPFLDRFDRAARAGFDAVEFWWPAGEDLGAVERRIKDAGLAVALFNFTAGEMAAGDRGLAADPDRFLDLRRNVPVALDLAERVGCPRLNALVGKSLPGLDRDRQLDLARANIAWVADRAAEAGREVLIEALNTFDNGPCLIATTRAAVEFIATIGRPNVKVQYDVYHMQRMEGNLVATLRDRIGEIAHIQIADAPGRGEPGTGEINYPFVLAEIDHLGYEGYVGLEYNPTTATTEESLGWLAAARR